MPAPGTFLSRFNTNEVVTGDHVDEHLGLLIGHINGGLTSKNLAPSYRTTGNAFAEDRGIFCLTGKSRNLVNDGAGGSVCVGQLGADSTLIGVSIAGATVTPSLSGAHVLVTVFTGNGNVATTVVSNFIESPTSQISTIDGSQNLLVSCFLPVEMAVNIFQSTIIHVQSNILSSTAIGSVGCWFKTSNRF